MDTTTFMLAALVAVMAGGFRGFAGFGSGLMMAPIMTLLMPPVMATPLILITSFAGSLRLLPEVWRGLQWSRVLALALPALLTIPVGAWLVQVIEPEIVQKTISVLVLLMVFVLASGWRYEGKVHAGVLAPAGAISGVLTGVGGVGGPPVVLLLMADTSSEDETRATLIAFLTFSQVVGISSFLFSGTMNATLGWMALGLAPLFVIAADLGARFFHGGGKAWYRRVALGFLAFVAFVGLVW